MESVPDSIGKRRPLVQAQRTGCTCNFISLFYFFSLQSGGDGDGAAGGARSMPTSLFGRQPLTTSPCVPLDAPLR